MRFHAATLTAAVASVLLPASAFAQPAASSPPPAAPPSSEPAPVAAPAKRPVAPGNLAGDLVGNPVREDEGAFHEHFVLDTGRHPFPAPNPRRANLAIHGEYQLRYRAMSDLPLTAPVSDTRATTLGQNQYLYHWLRLGVRFQWRDKLAIFAQADFPRGMIAGDGTQYVTAAYDSFDKASPFEFHPRNLYVEYTSPIGLFRVGHQTNHWGYGVLANDGDHPNLFGDTLRGSTLERILFATTPMGKGTPLTIALAGDLVYHDNTADLMNGDTTFQGAGAIMYRTFPAEIGLYGVVRHQAHARQSTTANTPSGTATSYTPFTDELTVGVLDLYGRFHAPIRGASAFVYGQAEGAMIFGSTTFVRSGYGATLDPTASRVPEKVRSYGGAAALGAVHVSGKGDEAWGNVVGEVEMGYASGDANPYDGTTKRFTFDPNHNVGLVLFDHVLAWKTARAATIAGDPSLVARPAAGLSFLPTNGGVAGAEYVNPRFIYRPRRWVDLKTGVVIAQTTADFVDPYHAGALGNFANYDGGDPRRHDLGVEIDLGFEFRIRMQRWATAQLGAEGGVLFPGHAFDDAAGHRFPNQYLANTKVGIQY